jgi:hypothetical protein
MDSSPISFVIGTHAWRRQRVVGPRRLRRMLCIFAISLASVWNGTQISASGQEHDSNVASAARTKRGRWKASSSTYGLAYSTRLLASYSA